MFKWPIYYTERTGLLEFTFNVRNSHHQPQCTLQLVYEKSVLYVWMELTSL